MPLSRQTLIRTLDRYGRECRPFFFLIGFDEELWKVQPLDELPDSIRYSIGGEEVHDHPLGIRSMEAPDYTKYRRKFDRVIEEIRRGNTYLFNLTLPTPIEPDASLEEIYEMANARYRLLYRGRFVSFSPESFVTIRGRRISTFPMKGTIDASIPDAVAKILSDPKELAEHTMIVDLLRNDLNTVASEVALQRFRYVEKIRAGEKELLQVSSEISGLLPGDWRERLGEILLSLLPAGSVTGTPKKKTVEIIKEIEGYERGFFTGVWGIFDGENLDSAVLIRYIEKNEDGYLFKSGGGITLDSDPRQEYEELLRKVYIP
ncbi:aminodeoxychorismate synthase component I [Nitratifractor sp.]